MDRAHLAVALLCHRTAIFANEVTPPCKRDLCISPSPPLKEGLGVVDNTSFLNQNIDPSSPQAPQDDNT